jgi:hypothetical protein
VSRRHDNLHRGGERDLELGRALEELGAPEYPPGFLTGVWARVDADRAAGDAPEVQASALSSRWYRGPWFRRRVIAVSAALVAVATLVTVVVLVGLPGASRVSGPEPVSAAQVIRKALRAMSSGDSLIMAITERDIDGYNPGGAADYKTTHVRFVMRSDGSYRVVQTDVAPASVAKGRPRKGFEGTVYDAPTGVFRRYVEGWEEDAGSYMHEAEVITGWPLGPPDAWVSLESGLQSVALALRSSGLATVKTASFGGRPAWTISATGIMALRDRTERTIVTIDRQTCLPLRVQAWKDGILQVEHTWRYISRDAPIPESTFTTIPTKHMTITHADAGFRRWPLARIAGTPGYSVLLPARSPAGYRLRWAAAAERSKTANELVAGRDVVALQYVRGFDGLTITTRTVSEPEEATAYDPVEWETSYARLVTRRVTLTAGAFSGATAHVVVAPGIMVPHLYAVKGHVMLIIVGAVTAKELISLAESLRPYRALTASPEAAASGQ